MIEVIERNYLATLVIECPARCGENGCPTHEGLTAKDWRTSKRLPPDTSIDYARVPLERHAEESPKSGPYRLVEYVTESKTTREVIEP